LEINNYISCLILYENASEGLARRPGALDPRGHSSWFSDDGDIATMPLAAAKAAFTQRWEDQVPRLERHDCCI
jgi:hypothetical protein